MGLIVCGCRSRLNEQSGGRRAGLDFWLANGLKSRLEVQGTISVRLIIFMSVDDCFVRLQVTLEPLSPIPVSHWLFDDERCTAVSISACLGILEQILIIPQAVLIL